MNLKRRNELTVAYFKTAYTIHFPAGDLTISPLEENSALKAFLQSNQIKTWALVSPCNPASVELTEAENQMRLVAFESGELKEKHSRLPRFKYFRTLTNPAPEVGFWIANIWPWEAVQMGFRHGQNAILVGGDDGCAELVWCEHASQIYTIRPRP